MDCFSPVCPDPRHASLPGVSVCSLRPGVPGTQIRKLLTENNDLQPEIGVWERRVDVLTKTVEFLRNTPPVLPQSPKASVDAANVPADIIHTQAGDGAWPGCSRFCHLGLRAWWVVRLRRSLSRRPWPSPPALTSAFRLARVRLLTLAFPGLLLRSPPSVLPRRRPERSTMSVVEERILRHDLRAKSPEWTAASEQVREADMRIAALEQVEQGLEDLQAAAMMSRPIWRPRAGTPAGRPVTSSACGWGKCASACSTRSGKVFVPRPPCPSPWPSVPPEPPTPTTTDPCVPPPPDAHPPQRHHMPATPENASRWSSLARASGERGSSPMDVDTPSPPPPAAASRSPSPVVLPPEFDRRRRPYQSSPPP
ncbi:MAG: hypothetical protein M1826_005804 [Phylliscum demangeonii]|nr:MAG: hypothetical protein M1826_005804 [Phylliscum demangeonii]